ncbi:hypothetical protein SLU01_01540 [Sporosarcina luteola]|uniref:Uncharacterized protein n=1 Tax=Sporosarcina luteola TaxID=582850 RepID=A0A511Z322_9BACL|nr:hypothetical protein [Sporosarcina luteola]GEN81842.1 hypothetical protein SLU01_01540 [Sporosarcina luteola]
MVKTDEQIVEEIADHLHGYLKEGTVSLRSFFSKAEIKIQNIEDLLKIRFLLLPETMNFVRMLRKNIQTIKTTTVAETATHYGEVRGSIDWTETTKERLRKNYKDKTIFSVTESVRSYNNPENIVLKELLGILYELLFSDTVIRSVEKRSYFEEWQTLRKSVADIYLRNVYIDRIETRSLPDRMLTKTRFHRNSFYRESAVLLIRYRQMMRGSYEQEDLHKILSQTLIVPEDRDVLFELFYVVQLLKAYSGKRTLYLLDGRQNLVASWEDEDKRYQLYHDSTGSQSKRFLVRLDEVADSRHPYLIRKRDAISSYHEMAAGLFSEKKMNYLWRGRPDFILETYNKTDGELLSLLIGEVKNTSKKSYASQGLRELLHYMYLLKDERGQYADFSRIKVTGMLCLRDVEFNEAFEHPLVKVINMESDLNIEKNRIER